MIDNKKLTQISTISLIQPIIHIKVCTFVCVLWSIFYTAQENKVSMKLKWKKKIINFRKTLLFRHMVVTWCLFPIWRTRIYTQNRFHTCNTIPWFASSYTVRKISIKIHTLSMMLGFVLHNEY